MNQILIVGKKRGNNNNSSVDIKKIVLFFSFAIIVFGLILIINGIVGLNKNNNNKNINSGIPSTPTPTSPIEIDEEAPKIELVVAGEKVNVIARDETRIDYVQYSWNDEETQEVQADEDDKYKIETSIELKQGTNTLKVIAVDKAGNTQEKVQEFKGTIRPTVKLSKNEATNELIIQTECLDGISKIEFTLNGNWNRIPFEEYPNSTKEDWESLNVIVDYSEDEKIIKAQYTLPMVDGDNRLNVYVYSLEGLVGEGDGIATKAPQQGNG